MQVMTQRVVEQASNTLANGVGELIVSFVSLAIWLSVLYFVGLFGKKTIYYKPELIFEDKINGVTKFSNPMVKANPISEVYQSCSIEFKNFLWAVIVFLPVEFILTLCMGVTNIVSFYTTK